MQSISKKQKPLLIALLIVILLSLIPVGYLFKEGFFLSDDGEWMVIRFSAFFQTLGNGQIPPRFFGRLNHGYGYPIGTFLYPAFMYLATPFKLIGLSYAEAIKAVIILSFLFSGVGSFFWLKHRFSLIAAIVGALVYVYFPYHLYDLYVRGSVGELVAFAVLPFLLISIDKKNHLWGGLMYGLLIASHNTFAFLLTPFLFGYTYFQHQRKLYLIYPLGLLASAFFWVPSLLELPWTRFSEVVISEWQRYFLTAETLVLGGFIGGILLLVSLYILFKGKSLERFFAAILIASIFFASAFSAVFWTPGILPKLVQFPWRFLILSVWAGSFITAYMINFLPGRRKVLGVIFFAFIIFISAVPILREYKPVVRDDGFYATNEDTTTTHGEYMPRWVKKVPTSHPEDIVSLSQGNGTISSVFQNSNRTQFILEASSPTTVVVNKIYYPGWQVVINGEKSSVTQSDEGYLQIQLPQGKHIVSLSFTETPFRLLSDVISGLTILMILLLLAIQAKIVPEKWYNKTPWKRN